MKLTLTLPPDLLAQLDVERGDRKYQSLILDLLRRATLPDPRLLVLEATIAAQEEEIARLHETLRALQPAAVLQQPAPPAVPITNGKAKEVARIEDW